MNPMRNAIDAINQVELPDQVNVQDIEVPQEFTLDLEPPQHSEPEVCILSEFAHEAIHKVACAHMWHLQTNSYAAHEAFGDFYEELSDLADTFLEACIGVNGPINPVDTMFDFKPIDEAIDYIKEFHCSANELHHSFQDSPTLTNPLEDIMTLCASTVYKLQYLS